MPAEIEQMLLSFSEARVGPAAGLPAIFERRRALLVPSAKQRRDALLRDRRHSCGRKQAASPLRCSSSGDAAAGAHSGEEREGGGEAGEGGEPGRHSAPEQGPAWRRQLTTAGLLAGLVVYSLLHPPHARARPPEAVRGPSEAHVSTASQPQQEVESREAADGEEVEGEEQHEEEAEEEEEEEEAEAEEEYREGLLSKVKRKLLFWRGNPYEGLEPGDKRLLQKEDAYVEGLRNSPYDGNFIKAVMLPPRKLGKRVDTSKSFVTDPAEWDKVQEPGAVIRPATAWRNDLYKRLTYTQFWQLVNERSVDKVEFTHDGLSVMATTKASAPGGVRTEKIMLPFDPSLFDHLMEHGVDVIMPRSNWGVQIMQVLVDQLTPIVFIIALVSLSFRLTAKSPANENVFGGADVEVFQPGQLKYSFDDVEGIDEVKVEVLKCTEIGELEDKAHPAQVVAFLRNPKRYAEMGIKSPAGLLLVGAPGTGKTLLAKAMAGEAGVPFLTIASTDFDHMYTGVGASRVRDVFEKARQAAPCILFIDEFDGVGRARSSAGSGGEENVQTINQMLTEMDGFDDNTGVVVMAATNRPEVLDEAITRPGRFDRLITLPLPNQEGRISIMKVHARDKKLAEDYDFERVARAAAGSTGAVLMNIMNESAAMAARRGSRVITTQDTFDALDAIQREAATRGVAKALDSEAVPPALRKSNAVYMAARALVGYLTPQYDELAKVVVNPGGTPVSYVYFLPSEDFLESDYVTRGYLEAQITVDVAGRVAERLVLGDNAVTLLGETDLQHANKVAREMVFRYGFNTRLGPIQLMRESVDYLNPEVQYDISNMGPEVSALAMQDIRELLHAADAKAAYALVQHWDLLKALVGRLVKEEVLTGQQFKELAKEHGAKPFPTPFNSGYTFEQAASLVGPGNPSQAEMEELVLGELFTPRDYDPAYNKALQGEWLHSNPYRLRTNQAYVLKRDVRDLSGVPDEEEEVGEEDEGEEE